MIRVLPLPLLCFLFALFSCTAIYATGINNSGNTHIDSYVDANTNKETTMIKRNNYGAETVGPCSISVRHANTLYVSGLTAFATPAQGKSMPEQADVIFTQLKQIAMAEGITLDNLLKVTVFVTSLEDVGALRDVLYKNYAGAFPASSLIQVAGLFSTEINIEIETVFAVDA